MIHEEIEHHIVPRRYVGASNRLRNCMPFKEIKKGTTISFTEVEELRPNGFRRLERGPLQRPGAEGYHAVPGFAAQTLLPGPCHCIELREVQRHRKCRRRRICDH